RDCMLSYYSWCLCCWLLIGDGLPGQYRSFCGVKGQKKLRNLRMLSVVCMEPSFRSEPGATAVPGNHGDGSRVWSCVSLPLSLSVSGSKELDCYVSSHSAPVLLSEPHTSPPQQAALNPPMPVFCVLCSVFYVLWAQCT